MTPHPVPCLVEDSVLGRGQASCSESVPRYDFDLSTVSDGSNVRQDFTLEELLQSVCLGDLLNGGNHRAIMALTEGGEIHCGLWWSKSITVLGSNIVICRVEWEVYRLLHCWDSGESDLLENASGIT